MSAANDGKPHLEEAGDISVDDPGDSLVKVLHERASEFGRGLPPSVAFYNPLVLTLQADPPVDGSRSLRIYSMGSSSNISSSFSTTTSAPSRKRQALTTQRHVWQYNLLAKQIQSFRRGKQTSMTAHFHHDREKPQSTRYQLQPRQPSFFSFVAMRPPHPPLRRAPG